MGGMSVIQLMIHQMEMGEIEWNEEEYLRLIKAAGEKGEKK